MMYNSSLAKEMNMYIEMRTECMSPGTVSSDKGTLAELDSFLVENSITEKSLSEATLNLWKDGLSGKSKTKNNKIGTVRGFVKYINTLGYEAFIPENIRVKSDYIPYIFTDEEIEQLIYYADNISVSRSASKFLHLKVPMVIRILYSCGTRLGETMALKRKDIDFKNSTLFFRETKFSKERCIPVHHSLLRILERYCFATGIMDKPDDFLFPGKKPGTHFTTRQMSEWFSILLEKADIDQTDKTDSGRGACIHCLRHLFVLKAMQQLEKAGHPVDMNDLLLPTYLGHTHMLDTDKYMRFSGVQVPESLQAFEDFTNNLIPTVEDYYYEED